MYFIVWLRVAWAVGCFARGLLVRGLGCVVSWLGHGDLGLVITLGVGVWLCVVLP